MNQTADTIIANAQVYTVDPTSPHAEAVAVAGSRILYVGNAEEALALRGPQTEVIDGQGRTLLPGLIDSHFHLLWGSLKMDDLQLDAATNPQQVAEMVRAHAAATSDEWIVGYQLLYSAFAQGTQLDRHFLDAIVADRPLLLTAFDYHTAWANTEALRRAGILQGRQLPPGHEIVMDPQSGLATGELREPEAIDPVKNLLPTPDEARTRALLKKGLARAASLGITSVHNMDGDEEQVRRYLALEDAGEMTLRIYMPYSITPATPLAELQEAAAWCERFHTSYVRAGAVKLFMDGVLESYTALMVEPYADAPGNCGSALFSAEHFADVAAEADRLELQIFVHACGDGAVRRTLDGYAHAQRVNGRRDSRHRVEHIEVIHPDDIARFSALGVIASMQPLHAPLTRYSAEVWPARAGRARWPFSFAWQTLRQAGAHLALGSDWPVVTMNPLRGFHAALNREPWAEGDPWQRQTLEQTIAGYTRDAAYAEFQEREKGQIRAGMVGDLVLLSENIFETPPAQLEHVHPLLTLCNGRIVYSK